ncbi:MAG TPA: S16 family serine protease [Jatrophihabitantaceae bacterium]
MTRRARTLIVAGVLFLVLFVVAVLMPVPYVVLSPGPTLNTLGADTQDRTIIVIRGRTPNQTTGHLNLTTVDITTNRVTAFQALIGWLQHDRVVVPRSTIYPPGQTEEQVNQQDTEQFASSQDNATAAAFCALNYPKGFGVLGVDANAGAKDKLRAFDQLVSLDGTPIDSQDKLTAALANRKPGESVDIAFKRLGKPMTTSIKLSAPGPGQKGARIGITVGEQCFAPFEVDLGLGDQIGGPSAGLMFALGIMDKVGSVDLTKGAYIAGTGEIQSDGKVLPIGGIQLKMIAARRAGAAVFLAPQDNCADVRGATPKGLNVIKVTALRDAVQDLLNLQAGKPVPHC